MKISLNNIIISAKKEQDSEILKEIEKNGINKENIKKLVWNKRSIDSRKKGDIKFIYSLEIELYKNINLDNTPFLKVEPKKVVKKVPIYEKGKEIAIIGAGPSGLFAALRLAELGYIPIIFERGEDIDKRDISVDKFVKFGILNPNSNIQFGEGGAGTYSDGKLNTRIKSEYIEKIFDEFVEQGAPKEILWDYKPHIGTDILKIVVKGLREKIKRLGGKFYFNHKLENIIVTNSTIKGIEIINNQNDLEYFSFDKVILAIGHSARTTYRMLHKNGVAMESKPFAIGTRIEHLQEDINKMQYGSLDYTEILGAATYNVTYNNKCENRGVFSFCMCPGGIIVNASSQEGGTLVNGMSYSKRDSKFSNSAIVVGIKPNDFGNSIFSGMDFQEKLEKKAYEICNQYGAVYQNVLDFINGKKTKFEIETSYQMSKTSYNLNEFFPNFISENLKSAFNYWAKNPLFITKKANLIAPETRTSSPIKIIRDIKGESISVKGVYPIGEGAGYAGGIVSAAVDGIKVVDLSFSIKKY